MNTINIKTGNGSMTINIDNFFPCSQARFNKLFKIVRQFSWLNDVQAIAEQLNQHFTEQIQDNEITKAGYAKRHFRQMQAHADYRDMVESGKHPNGIPLTKEELKDFKKRMVDAGRWAKQYLCETKKIDREISALKKNLEMLGSLEM
jgi:hypothetical protein